MEAELDRLRRRLERERAARREAESIAEETTRNLYDRQRELSLLESVAAACNDADDLVTACQVTLERVCSHLGWPLGLAWTPGERDPVLRFCGVAHLDDSRRFDTFLAESVELELGKGVGLPGRVLEELEPVWLDDLADVSQFPRAASAAAAGLQAGVAFPVVVDERVVAVLECFSGSVLRPTPELLRVLAQIGSPLARVFERAATEERLRHDATHDPLTGLANRTLFADRLEQALRLGRRAEDTAVAVALLDLDRFKEVNDTLGHQHGDELLSAVGDRLAGALRESDTIARLGGDEFGLVLPLLGDGEGAMVATQRLRDALLEPFLLDGVLVQVDTSIGIALFPHHGDESEVLMRRADIAMYEAKRTHAGCLLYKPANDPYSPARLGMVAALRQALETGVLVLHYQPKLDIEGDSVCGVEALVRWPDPERGLIAPGEFIPLAEHTGLIKPLTSYVLQAAIAQGRRWLDAGLRVPIAVNIEGRSLLDPAFPAEVERLLAAASVPPDLLELEVTERTMLQDPERALAALEHLSGHGIAISIDDFGTGYSSLAQLKQLPVDQLKIDRGFVAAMQQDERDAFIVRSTIALGHDLGLRVIAEGVEDAGTLDDLAQLGCDSVQGFLIHRPAPADDITRWLHARGPVAQGAPEAA